MPSPGLGPEGLDGPEPRQEQGRIEAGDEAHGERDRRRGEEHGRRRERGNGQTFAREPVEPGQGRGDDEERPAVETALVDRDSPRNWRTSWDLGAPTALRMPTSLARLAERAVARS